MTSSNIEYISPIKINYNPNKESTQFCIYLNMKLDLFY